LCRLLVFAAASCRFYGRADAFSACDGIFSGCLFAFFAHKGDEHTVFDRLFSDSGNNNTLNVRQLSGFLWLFCGCIMAALRMVCGNDGNDCLSFVAVLLRYFCKIIRLARHSNCMCRHIPAIPLPSKKRPHPVFFWKWLAKKRPHIPEGIRRVKGRAEGQQDERVV
jgi:hypothetical protein